MSLRTHRRFLLLALGGAMIASPALAARMASHTGVIVAENMKRDTVTIEEMGPWHGPSTRPVRREFHLTPRTTLELAVRTSEPSDYKGRFIDQPLKATDLRPGDYATVTVRHEDGKAIATKIEIVRPGQTAPVQAESPARLTVASAVR